MPALLCLALAVGLAGVAFVARPLYGFTATLASVFLVPAALRLPHAPQLLTFPRLVMLGLLFGLARQVRHGKISAQVFRPGKVHAAYAVFLAVALIVGVGLADPFTDVATTTAGWFVLFDQALFFVLCVACLRVIDDSLLVLGAVAVVLTLSSVIALVEHWTGNSWGHWWFQSSTLQSGYTGGLPLQVRNGEFRVRAAADFAVAFAWLSMALLPAYFPLLSRSSGWRRLLVFAGLGATLAAIYWSYTRSVLLGLVVILVLIGPLARNLKITQLAFVLVIAGALLGLAQPGVSARFSSAVDQNSIDTRNERNPLILDRISAQPVTGLGLGALDRHGFAEVDQAYLSLYGAIGVVGLASFVLLIGTAIGSAARGLRSKLMNGRLVSASSLLGMATILVGAAAFDAFTSTAAGRLFALFAAIGVVAAEPALGPARWLIRFRWWRLAIVPLALVAGLVVAKVAPTHVAATAAFKSISSSTEAAAEPEFAGQELLASVCEVVHAQSFSAGTRVQCRLPNIAPGFGELYFSAPTEIQIYQAVGQLQNEIGRHGVLNGFQLLTIHRPTVGTATILRTAPIWLTILSLGAALLVPGSRRRAPGHQEAHRREPVIVGA